MRRLALLAALVLTALGAAPRAVYPTGGVVPQRLLRISIVFAEPADPALAGGIRLLRADGTAIERPFADPPLWSADLTTLTLLLDPSRQKDGLRNHADAGYVLPAAGAVTLAAGGVALKRWTVRAGACPPLDPARWRVSPVRAGTREPLLVRFGAAVDGLSAPYLALARGANARLAGRGTLLDHERAWRFVPARPWQAGDRLAIHPRFEDPCGDEIGEPFEHRPGTGLDERRTTTFRALSIGAARQGEPGGRRKRSVHAHARPDSCRRGAARRLGTGRL